MSTLFATSCNTLLAKAVSALGSWIYLSSTLLFVADTSLAPGISSSTSSMLAYESASATLSPTLVLLPVWNIFTLTPNPTLKFSTNFAMV